MKSVIVTKEQEFRDWLRSQMTPDGVRRFTDNTIIAYCHALRTLCPEIAAHTKESVYSSNLFLLSSALEYDAAYEELIASPAFLAVNEASGNNVLLTGMDLYRFFLHNGKGSQAPEVYTPIYRSKPFSRTAEEDSKEKKESEFFYVEIPMTPIQKIYYGVPGTGKSFRVRNFLNTQYPDPHRRDAHCRRVIFHPTYTYEDFVGGVRARLSPDKELYYVYAAGPFTLLLKEAFLHSDETFYLVIEEINRGNAPAIFGDLFQLLDRQESGRSMYAVQNNDLIAYFSRDPALKGLFNGGKVWLPPNFNIIATMNTADENIFVLDNAFKRRFAMEYIGISFEGLPEGWTRNYPVFAGATPLTTLFEGTDLEDYVSLLDRQGVLSRNWPTFALLVNRLIDCVNAQKRASGLTADALIAENKKLGPFFLSESEVSDRHALINKVIFYLKQDVFFASQYMTPSFEEICACYDRKEGDLFRLLLPH